MMFLRMMTVSLIAAGTRAMKPKPAVPNYNHGMVDKRTYRDMMLQYTTRPKRKTLTKSNSRSTVVTDAQVNKARIADMEALVDTRLGRNLERMVTRTENVARCLECPVVVPPSSANAGGRGFRRLPSSLRRQNSLHHRDLSFDDQYFLSQARRAFNGGVVIDPRSSAVAVSCPEMAEIPIVKDPQQPEPNNPQLVKRSSSTFASPGGPGSLVEYMMVRCWHEYAKTDYGSRVVNDSSDDEQRPTWKIVAKVKNLQQSVIDRVMELL